MSSSSSTARLVRSFRFFFCRFTLFFFCYRRRSYFHCGPHARVVLQNGVGHRDTYSSSWSELVTNKIHDALGATNGYCRYPGMRLENVHFRQLSNLGSKLCEMRLLGCRKDFLKLIDTHASCRLDRRDPLRRPACYCR
jgi:hypothetical protein